jgi:uroporphyrinogen decarboxylase
MSGRFRQALGLQRPDRIPFVPAVYEHKAWFIGKMPSEVCRDGSLLVEATLAEYEALQPDAMVVGIDVYNVEAEAAGCGVTYFAGPDTSVPSATPGGETIAEGAPAGSVAIPDPRTSGRMPLMLDATARVAEKLKHRVPVMGAVTGPFSLAAALCGPATLFMAMVSNPGWARDLIGIALRIALDYGRAFAERGLGVTVFDSQASPGLISPARYKEFVQEPTRDLIAGLKSAGMADVPLVIGGNTDAIVDGCIGTGGNYILCDGPASTRTFVAACRAARCAFRKNIPSAVIASATVEEIRHRAASEVALAEGYPGFILGTGVIVYGTATEKILAVKGEAELKGPVVR